MQVDELDHVKGSNSARVTMIGYYGVECPYSGEAYTVIESLVKQVGDPIRHVFRHFPLLHKHPHAQQAAEAAEAAAAQGRFWDMCDLLFSHQAALDESDLLGYARWLNLDRGQFETALVNRTFAKRVYRDIAAGRRLGISGTPTIFVNGNKIDDDQDLAGAVLKALAGTQAPS